MRMWEVPNPSHGIIRETEKGIFAMGRYPVTRKRTVDIHYLHPRHRSMARTMVGGGLTPSDLAVLYGMSKSQISVVINSPLFRAEVARIEALAENNVVDARMELNMLKGRSVEVLAEDLHSTDAKLRHASAIDVLDRTGHPKGAPVQKSVNLHGHVHASTKHLNQRELYETVMNLVEEEDDEDELEFVSPSNY